MLRPVADLHPIEASALHARRERVFLVLAGIFLGSMTMGDIHVGEVFFEARIPLAQDQHWIE